VWKKPFVVLCIACEIFVCFACSNLSKPGKKEKENNALPLMTSSPGLFSNPFLNTVLYWYSSNLSLFKKRETCDTVLEYYIMITPGYKVYGGLTKSFPTPLAKQFDQSYSSI